MFFLGEFAVFSCFEQFRLHFVQLLVAVKAVEGFHQLFFREPGRQAESAEQLCFPLSRARCTRKPPLIEVGISNLPPLRLCRGNASFFAQSVPERLQNEGIVHALDPQKPLFAGLSLPLFLAVDGRNVGLHHVLLPHQICDIGADAEARRVGVRQKSSLVNFFLIIALSLPCVLGYNVWAWDGFAIFGGAVLDVEDFLVSNLFLPLGSLVYLLFCVTRYGWGWDNYKKEVNTGKGLKMHDWMRGYLTYGLPLIVLFIFVFGLYDKFIA